MFADKLNVHKKALKRIENSNSKGMRITGSSSIQQRPSESGIGFLSKDQLLLERIRSLHDLSASLSQSGEIEIVS